MSRSVTHLQVLAFVWHYVRRYKLLVTLMVSFLLIQISCTLVQPLFYKQAVDLISAADPADPGVVRQVILFVLIGIACGVTSLTLHEVATLCLSWMDTKILRQVHSDVFAKIQRLSTRFHISTFAGSTARKINRGVDAVESVIDQMWFHFLPIFVFVTGLATVLTIFAPLLGIVMIVGILVYIAVAVSLNLVLARYYSWASEQDTNLTASLVDTITGNALVKAFSAEVYEEGRHGEVVTEWRRRWWISWRNANLFTWIQFMVLMCVELAALLTAVYLWYRGEFTAGGFIVAIFYIGQIWGRVFDIGRNIREYIKAVAYGEEMVEMYQQPYGVADQEDATDLTVTKGTVALNSITFTYENTDQPIYEDFSLEIAGGEHIALVGHSGGGKSTFVKLLMRLYDMDAGTITIDGQNIAGVTQESLRKNVALVPQDPILFHRSVGENIAYARPDATAEEIEEAARRAHAHEFISKLPDTYNTLVGERGVKLSGGERQRVAIARAILADKPILVLDEATSSLDSASELHIQEGLKELMKGRTAIVIAHRLSTIKAVDRIVVIENGEILEQGSHSELLKLDGGLYRELYELQAGGFM